VPLHQIADQNEEIKTAKRTFVNVSQLRYMLMAVTNQNLIQEEFKRRLNSGSPCYHSAQTLLSSHLLSKNVKIVICKTMSLPVVMYECETLSLTLRQDHRLRVFENRVLRKIFGLKRDEVMGGWKRLNNEELCDLYTSPRIT
jgi:hypothetical protein